MPWPFQKANKVRRALRSICVGVHGLEPRRLLSQSTLADLWHGRAVFQEDTRAIGFKGEHFLSLTRDSLELKSTNLKNTYYIRHLPDGRLGTGIAHSDDGILFVDGGTTLGPGNMSNWDHRMASFSSVWKEESTWYMVYEGTGGSAGDIGLASSVDGVSWVKEANPILKHTEGKNWERINIGTPCLYHEGDTWYLFYHGFDGHDLNVGLATGRDLSHLTRANGGQPILSPSTLGWDDGTIGKRSILKENEHYYMVYEGSRDLNTAANKRFDTVSWNTGIARATSLVGPWEKLQSGPVLTGTPRGFGYDGPEWVRTPDGNLYIYFRDPVNLDSTRRATLVARPEVNLPLVFEAETDLRHNLGMREGDGWSTRTAPNRSGFLSYGPYTRDIPVGRQVAVFRLMIDKIAGKNSAVATVDVYDASSRKVLGSRIIRRKDFSVANRYLDFNLAFQAPGSGHQLEFRVYWHATAYIRQDKVQILPS